MIRLILTLSILSSGVFADHALAWNSLGHKVIAQIAWKQLSESEQQSIVDVLRRHPRFDADFAAKMTDDVLKADNATQDRWIFQHAATWPDVARGNKDFDRPTWHYINLPLFVDSSDRRSFGRLSINLAADYKPTDDKQQFNVLQAIKYCRTALENKSAGPEFKALAYSWLLHLVGDIHQPLHSSALFSANRFQKGDRGGNSIPLAGGENLHSRWDGLLGRRDLIRNVDREAFELGDRSRYGEAWDNALSEMSPKKWADESHAICESIVYSTEILSAVRSTPATAKEMTPLKLSPEYMKQAGDVARKQMIKAGVRLGRLLHGGPIEREAEPAGDSVTTAQPLGITNDSTDRPVTTKVTAGLTHWLNTNTNVRHNSSCRWYRKTTGRDCKADEGTPCEQCGG